MSGVFEKLRAALKAPAATSADLHKAIAAAADLADVAVADRARLSDQRADMLVASDGERAKWKAALADADERQADAGAFALALTERLAMVERAEDQAVRRRAYDQARAKAEAAVKMVRRDYAAQAQKLLALVRTIAEAQIEVDRVNAALPAGASPIEDVELTARGRAAQSRRELRTTEIELWCNTETGQPIGAEYQQRVAVGGDGQGYLNTTSEASQWPAASSYPRMERRRFKRVEFLPPTEWHIPPRISSELSLPGYYKPPMANPFGFDAASVIAAIDAALAAKPDLAEPQPQSQVELVPIPAEPSAEKPKVQLAELVDNGRSRFASQPRSARGGRR